MKAYLPNFILLTALFSRRSNQVAPPVDVRSGDLESLQTGLNTCVCKDDQLVRFAFRCCREPNHVTAQFYAQAKLGTRNLATSQKEHLPQEWKLHSDESRWSTLQVSPSICSGLLQPSRFVCHCL